MILSSTFVVKRLVAAKGLGRIGVISISCILAVGLATAAYAEQIRISDASGATRSMSYLAQGASASLQVQLEGEGFAGVTVDLRDTATEANVSSCVSSPAGMCQMDKVLAGSYALEVDKAGVAIAQVSILGSKASGGHAGMPAEESRSLSRAMYVAGASAVAGVAGIVAANSGSSSGGTALNLSRSEGSVGVGGGSELPVTAADPEGRIGTNEVVISPAPSNINLNPAPTGGTINSAPPASGSSGPTDATLGGGSGDTVSKPDEPASGDIAPAPGFTDPKPLTPSS